MVIAPKAMTVQLSFTHQMPVEPLSFPTLEHKTDIASNYFAKSIVACRPRACNFLLNDA